MKCALNVYATVIHLVSIIVEQSVTTPPPVFAIKRTPYKSLAEAPRVSNKRKGTQTSEGVVASRAPVKPKLPKSNESVETLQINPIKETKKNIEVAQLGSQKRNLRSGTQKSKPIKLMLQQCLQ